LKLTNCLQVRVTDVFVTIVFRASLSPYLRLTTIGMKINTLIEHKETIVVCEENRFVSMSYNVLLTTPEVNVRVKLVIHVVIAKSALTTTDYGKTDHSMETCHNKKRYQLCQPL
jgi:hypothetical protein